MGGLAAGGCGEFVAARLADTRPRAGVAVVLAGLTAVWWGWLPGGAAPAAQLPGLALWGWALLVLAVVDLRVRRLPNALIYPLTPAVIALLVSGALAAGAPGAAGRVPLAALAGFGALAAVALIRPGDLGMGDVKFAALIAAGLAPLGWEIVAAGLLAGFLSAGLSAAALLASGRRRADDTLAFGPHLACGALLASMLLPV